jgi:Ca-activated chloride channel family protein
VTFFRPEMLALVPIVMLILALAVAAQSRRHRKLADAFGGSAAARRLTSRELTRFPRCRLACLIGAGMAMSLAAAGPYVDLGATLDPTQPVDLVIAVDLSLSMTGTDVGPSRLERAKSVIRELTEAMPNERLALIVFADWPYSILPMTDDQALVRFFTEPLSPDLLEERDQGTSFALVITHAHQMLQTRRRPEAQPVILLITDGEGHEEEAEILDAVATVAAAGVRVWTAGVGTTGGSELATLDPDPLPVLGEDGEPVVSRLNEGLLRRIASAGGGGYRNVSGRVGFRSLLGVFRRANAAATPGGEAVGSALWLVLLASTLLFLEGKMDAAGIVELPRLAELKE